MAAQAEESETQSVSPAEMKRRWRAQQEDVEFPDEVPFFHSVTFLCLTFPADSRSHTATADRHKRWQGL